MKSKKEKILEFTLTSLLGINLLFDLTRFIKAVERLEEE